MSFRKSSSKKRNRNKDAEDELPNPLDGTRIHPEDYDLAKHMVLNAMDLDDDDVDDDAHQAQIAARLMDDSESGKKLAALELGEFAANLLASEGRQKRVTLAVIRKELSRPFGERREPFGLPDEWDILTMLTGETVTTLKPKRIVSVSIQRVHEKFISVRMDSGIEGGIGAAYISDDAHRVLQKGQTIPAAIVGVKVGPIRVAFDAKPSTLAGGDDDVRKVALDEYYDVSQLMRDKDLRDRKKRREVEQSRRIIKHPNFFNMNYKKAEEMLASQQRGDVVIRPSTKGPDHIAVTWKVDDGVYQHIGECLIVMAVASRPY